MVLDLDETLIHSVFQPVENADINLRIPEDVTDDQGNKFRIMNDIYVFKRPGVDMFLKRLSRYYELVIFTASIDKYANPVIDNLDTQNLTRHRLYREHCTFMYNVFIKDLKRLGRRMEDILILDNSPISYLFQKQNALPIKTWLEDKNDIELYKYLRLLEYLAKIDDVRKVITMIVDQETNQIDFDIFDQIVAAKPSQSETNHHDRRNIVSETRSNKLHLFGCRSMLEKGQNNSGSVQRKHTKAKLKMFERQEGVKYQIPIVDKLVYGSKLSNSKHQDSSSKSSVKVKKQEIHVSELHIDTMTDDIDEHKNDHYQIFSAQYSAISEHRTPKFIKPSFTPMNDDTYTKLFKNAKKGHNWSHKGSLKVESESQTNSSKKIKRS